MNLRDKLSLWWTVRKRTNVIQGLLVIGTVKFPVDSITLSGGKINVSGEVVNPFPDGMRGAGWPKTYQLYGIDGTLIRAGRLPLVDFGTSTEGMRWRFTVGIKPTRDAEEAG